MELRTYVSGALTGLPPEKEGEIKKFYKNIGELAENCGIKAVVPHLRSDKHKSLSPKEVFAMDKYDVLHSTLLIAYVGYPSLGSGMEIAYAEEAEIPCILLYERDRQVSRMVRGAPNISAEIRFEAYSDCLSSLGSFLRGLVSQMKDADERNFEIYD